MKRIETSKSQGRDYKKMLKDYFGKYLYGLDVRQDGGQVQAQVIYFDFKHIDTVRRELVQMMPEVEFTKLRRDFTNTAESWVLSNMLWPEYKHIPVVYVQRGDTLVRSTIKDIARAELNQLELDEDDIAYGEDSDLRFCSTQDDEKLIEHSWD